MGWDVIAIVEELEHTGKHEHVPIDEIHKENHPVWGSFFSSYHEYPNDYKKTFWANLVCNHADLIIPCLTSLIEIETDSLHPPKNHFLHPCPIILPEVPSRHLYYGKK